MTAVNEDVFHQWRARLDACLDSVLPQPSLSPKRLHQAMRYATLGQGKRIRPLLVYATGHLLSVDYTVLDGPAAAIELVHCYSLIHDDLPAMDDDRLRRGRPTVHVAFDEATAILAGDALLALAFEQLTANNLVDAGLRCQWLKTVASASGSLGMCGGQALDLEATAHHSSQAQLETIHSLKTGALICASIRLATLASACSPSEVAQLDHFARQLGLAFQVRDDILDVASSAELLGKTPGKDAKSAKSTFVALLGLSGAQQYLDQIAADLDILLDYFDKNRCGPLRALAKHAVQRSN